MEWKDTIGIAQGMEQLSVCYFNPESLVESIVKGHGFHGNQEGPYSRSGALSSRVWVRCESLILQFSRPWQTHFSRVRVFDEAGNATPKLVHFQFPPTPPPPASLPPPPTCLTEMTVVIQELTIMLPTFCLSKSVLSLFGMRRNFGWYCCTSCSR